MAKTNPKSGLTPKDEKFAALVAQGYTNSDAYRATRNVGKDTKPESVWRRASHIATSVPVRARVRELLDVQKLRDIIPPEKWAMDVQNDIDLARSKGNMTAVMSGHRLIGQGIDTLRESIDVNVSESDDETVIKRLAGGDPHKASMLRAIAGKDDFEDA